MLLSTGGSFTFCNATFFIDVQPRNEMSRRGKMREMGFFIKHNTQAAEWSQKSQPSASNKKFICPAGSVLYTENTHRSAGCVYFPPGGNWFTTQKNVAAHTYFIRKCEYISQRERCKSRTRQRQKFAKVHCTLLLINFPFELGQTSIFEINCRSD